MEDNRYMTIDEILETDIGKEVTKELEDKMIKRIKQEFPEWSKLVTFEQLIFDYNFLLNKKEIKTITYYNKIIII